MTNSLHFNEWGNCISAQRKVDLWLCAPGAPKGPKVGMSVRYEILCANDAGRAPRKHPASEHDHQDTDHNNGIYPNSTLPQS